MEAQPLKVDHIIDQVRFNSMNKNYDNVVEFLSEGNNLIKSDTSSEGIVNQYCSFLIKYSTKIKQCDVVELGAAKLADVLHFLLNEQIVDKAISPFFIELVAFDTTTEDYVAVDPKTFKEIYMGPNKKRPDEWESDGINIELRIIFCLYIKTKDESTTRDYLNQLLQSNRLTQNIGVFSESELPSKGLNLIDL